MEMDKNELLDKVKELLKKDMTALSFDTWFKNLSYYTFTETEITFLSETAFIKDLMQTQYTTLLQQAFAYLTNKCYKISFIVESEADKNIQIPLEKNTIENPILYTNSSLKQQYTFNSFVVGNNNRLAHAAALAVTESPGKSYNPLFLYGGAGLGKTHLMHAIGNEILKNHPNFKILYVTSETFTNELVNSIKDNSNINFRNKYRNLDLLLIDDIQFIAKKDAIQEEFFHTFNTLRENGKQIVITSDKAPRDIQLLEDRLKSRFEWGLLADISSPDYETRLAILRKKADIENIIIDDEILSDIASKIDTNIRELEGALNKIIAHATLSKGPITLELAQKSIHDIVTKKEKVITVEYIQEVVSNYFGVEVKDLKSAKKSNDIVFPRQIAMYLCRSVANASLTRIGDDFGNRDHTTVMYALKKIEKEVKTDPSIKLIVDNVKKNLTE